MGLRGHEQCLPLNANKRLGKDTKLDGRTAVLGSFSTKGAHYSPINKSHCGRLGAAGGQCQYTGYMGPWAEQYDDGAALLTATGKPNDNLMLGCPSGYQQLGDNPRETYRVNPDAAGMDWTHPCPRGRCEWGGDSWDADGGEEHIPADLADGLSGLPMTAHLPDSRNPSVTYIRPATFIPAVPLGGEYPEQFMVRMDGDTFWTSDQDSRDLMAKTDGDGGFFW